MTFGEPMKKSNMKRMITTNPVKKLISIKKNGNAIVKK